MTTISMNLHNVREITSEHRNFGPDSDGGPFLVRKFTFTDKDGAKVTINAFGRYADDLAFEGELCEEEEKVPQTAPQEQETASVGV